MEKISVIVTVKNEERTIDKLLASLSQQTIIPKEIIVIDAYSTDATWEILKKAAKSQKNLKIYQQAGNRSMGRNFGVEKSTTNIIAITDAGCIPEKNWLFEITKPFSNPKVSVISGYYKGIANSIFEKCLIPYTLVMPDKIPSVFFPSARSMSIRKSIFNFVGGFDPKIDPGEDYDLANRLIKKNIDFYFNKNAIVEWYPRKNIYESISMFFRFACADIVAGNIRTKVKYLAIRYIGLIYLLFLSKDVPQILPFIILALCCYLVWSIFKNYKYVKNLKAFFWLPVLQITSDISILFGSAVGLFYRAAI